jgi:hypothetical protein
MKSDLAFYALSLLYEKYLARLTTKHGNSLSTVELLKICVKSLLAFKSKFFENFTRCPRKKG